jgi:hypothetical protein
MSTHDGTNDLLTGDTPATKTKYDVSTAERWRLASDVRITDHALERYRERTPEDCDVAPVDAWLRGEDLDHPEVCRLYSGKLTPARVRVYNHDDDWLVAFVIVDDGGGPAVVTCYNGRTHEHSPTRAYLWARASHAPDGGAR